MINIKKRIGNKVDYTEEWRLRIQGIILLYCGTILNEDEIALGNKKI